MRAARAWFHEPNCEAAICDLASIIDREFAGLVEAAKGLSCGDDWNNGTHALKHGYRQKLLDALAKIGGGA
jgi:hypothetical protein